MKKWLAMLLAVLTVISLAACSGEKADSADVPKLFVCEELRITLNMNFIDADPDTYNALFHSDDVDVLVLREDKAGFDADMDFERYTQLIKNANQQYEIKDLLTDGNLSYYEYAYKGDSGDEKYECMAAMMESDKAYWLVQFFCMESDYSDYKNQFIAWANTIIFA